MNYDIKPWTFQTIIFKSFCIIVVFITSSCNSKTNNSLQLLSPRTSTWYKQAMVDLGNRIAMTSPNDGIAISRGVGREVKGKAYRFHNGQWTSFFEYDYSDYPLIAQFDSTTIWTVTHRTHEGAYRPIISEFKKNNRRELHLPTIMWDDIDFVMFKGIHCFSDGTAWVVGQQGHILFYDGTTWKEVKSPLINVNRETVYEGDLNDIAMTSKQTGWAVGRNGIIIRYENAEWKKVESPVNQPLQKISMVNDSTGWAVGNSGTILECKHYHWSKIPTDVREHLNSIFAMDETHAWIVGNNSTFLVYNGEHWMSDEAIKNYDDSFFDISVVKDSTDVLHYWVIGGAGIYTTSQSLGFSFTDITNQAGLRRVGKLGNFFHRSNDDVPDILVSNDGGSSLLFENKGGDQFADVTSKTELLRSPRDAVVMAIGDVNNDGEQDVLQLIDDKNFKLFLGTFDGAFRDFTERSKLRFDEINSTTAVAAKFIDLNNDGNLDLYISNFDLPDQIFIGNGAGEFSRINPKINKILGHASYGAVFADFNNDNRIDVMIPYYVSFKNKFFSLFLNNGNMNFTEKDDSIFYSSTDLSPSAIAAADFNNDGNIDLYIHSQKIPSMVWTNDGSGAFTSVGGKSGLTQFVNHPEPINGIVGTADVNNDGWIDIFDGTKLYLNNSHHNQKMFFTEVSERVGIQFTGTPTFEDVDNDGDMDLFIGSSRGSLGKGDRAALFRNNLNNNQFIKIKVFGDESNHSAIGTRVNLYDANDSLLQSKVIGGGGNQLGSQNLTELHFGVPISGYYSVESIFPSGKRKRINNIYRGENVTVNESNLFTRGIVSLQKSVGRTLLLIDLISFVMRILLFAGICILFFITGKKLKAENISHKWFSYVGIAFLFSIATHLSIYERKIVSLMLSSISTVGISFALLIVARIIIQKRDARYISHFKILELLGAGGMGKVYKAIDSETKKIVALKVLNPELLKDPENRRRLSAEGHLLASFNHPNIVKVFEIGESNERGFIAMEYLNGGTLKEKLEKNHPLSLSEIKQYLIQVCDGLSEVHRNGIIHRDLKTGNLMLTEDNFIRIMDFGLSKSPLVTTMTSLGTVLGTLGYVAPEQVTSLNVDQRTDIFSLGVVMYELLTNQLPFKGENEIALIHSIFNTTPPVPSSLRSDVSRELDQLIMMCLKKNNDERCQNVGEVKNILMKLD